jgi:2-furoyl-CoA dehydrogenase 2Fe-2S iron sulfur subunit
MLAVQVDGRRVDTVEGLGRSGGLGGVLGDLQAAFKKHFALQCGFCTAGILMSCAHWLEQLNVPDAALPDEADVRTMLSGHICRCTGYTPIVQAVLEVAHARFLAQHPAPHTTGVTHHA